MLHGYYLNNGVYDIIQQIAYANSIWTPAMKGLRNPSHRAVEFYVSKLWPGALPEALPIKTKNPAIIEPIQQFWKWSNFGATKQVAARWVSEYGDWFLKVSTNASPVTRVYSQNIKPEYVTDFDVDERGFIIYIRIEIPKIKTVEGLAVKYLHVEIWDKATGYYLRYELRDSSEKLDQGNLKEKVKISEFGIDFVPFVHAKFQDIGEKRGVGCFVHVLDKIDEANRMATRLHQILFRYNKAIMAVSANGNDAQGRPLPPPVVGGGNSATVNVPEDEDLWALPGMASLEAMVPNLQYDSYLNAVNAQMDEIKQDLPEIKYFDLDTSSQLSGKAIGMLLGDAVDKVLEVRGNMETALARADEMALTMMKNAGLGKVVGDFENGDFEHSFEEREVFSGSQQDKADENIAFWNGWASIAGGEIPFETYALSMGWTLEKLKNFGTQKAAAILASQEDVVPTDGL